MKQKISRVPFLLGLLLMWWPNLALAAPIDEIVAAARKDGVIELYATNNLGPKGAGAGNSASFAQNKGFSRPEPEADHSTKQDEIPIIEENYTPPAAEDNPAETHEAPTDEIDVKDIPF